MKKNWTIKPRADGAERLAAELKIHPAVASILLRRGHKTSSEIFGFLNPSIDSLESPFVFQDMQKAVDRIRLAVSRKEKILVYGDYDVDGITGSAILVPVLKKIGADVDVHIPHRIHEGYGLNQDTLEKLLKKKKFGLVITVDNGITGVKPIAFLNEKGVDVIVVDHHLPKDGMPQAFAIVSAATPPSRHEGGTGCGGAGGGGGDGNLAACGLAFKLAWALLGEFKHVEEFLDLVAVGTIADIAAVTGENRILLKVGMSVLAKTKRTGLRALMDAARINPAYISYRDIAFGLGPRINASGRMGSPETAYRLLTTDNALEAQNLAQILEEGNRDRQRVENDAFEEAIERVERDSFAVTEKAIVVESEDWHEGVLGIVASRLVERYHRPAVVIALKDDQGKGSGRSLPGVPLFDCVLKCEDLLANFGGHAQACGLTIRRENVPAFRRRLNEAVNARFGDGSVLSELSIDEEILLPELTASFVKDLEKLAPFGPGNEKPLFISKNLKQKSTAKKRGRDTLQCWITDQEGKTICELIGFRAYERWTAERQKTAFDIVHQPTLRQFNGITSLELQLEDWR